MEFSDLIPQTLIIPPKAFDDLERLLSEPVKADPKLKALLSTPTVFDQD